MTKLLAASCLCVGVGWMFGGGEGDVGYGPIECNASATILLVRDTEEERHRHPMHLCGFHIGESAHLLLNNRIKFTEEAELHEEPQIPASQPCRAQKLTWSDTCIVFLMPTIQTQT